MGLCSSAFANLGNSDSHDSTGILSNLTDAVHGQVTEDVCSDICRCPGTTVMCLREDTLTDVPQMTPEIASKVTEL